MARQPQESGFDSPPGNKTIDLKLELKFPSFNFSGFFKKNEFPRNQIRTVLGPKKRERRDKKTVVD